jgi:hypothetical protein
MNLELGRFSSFGSPFGNVAFASLLLVCGSSSSDWPCCAHAGGSWAPEEHLELVGQRPVLVRVMVIERSVLS